MGVVLSLGYASGLIAVASWALVAMTRREARAALLFAVPQRRTIAASRFVRENLALSKAYHRIWRPEERPEHDRGRLDLERFVASDMDDSPLARRDGLTHATKRVMDIVLSLFLLVFTAPVLLLVALAIRLDSPGPIFYRQTRVGADSKTFDVIKFRTMVTDAEKDGPKWASASDSRITRVGQFLRRSRIDEIPQVIPILKGHMSFIGPRPERPEFTSGLERDIPHYAQRYLVKPGLTGWAQVNAPYAASVEASRLKLSYDLYYIRHYSFLLDAFILIKTVKVTIFAEGAH